MRNTESKTKLARTGTAVPCCHRRRRRWKSVRKKNKRRRESARSKAALPGQWCPDNFITWHNLAFSFMIWGPVGGSEKVSFFFYYSTTPWPISVLFWLVSTSASTESFTPQLRRKRCHGCFACSADRQIQPEIPFDIIQQQQTATKRWKNSPQSLSPSPIADNTMTKKDSTKTLSNSYYKKLLSVIMTTCECNVHTCHAHTQICNIK